MKNSIKLILIGQIILLITIKFDISIMRQFFGFFYLSFIPGYLILKILRIDINDKIDILLLSLGLSISFLMFFGIFVNFLYPLFDIIEPLSTFPLITTLFCITIILLYIYNKHVPALINFLFIRVKNITLKIILLFSIPILSVIGSIYKNNFLLLFMFIIIIISYILIIFNHIRIDLEYPNLYPIIIFLISISLLFQTSLISNYLIGYDVHAEKYVFEITKHNLYWDLNLPFTSSRILNYNSMISVTILPTIYSSILNVNAEIIFKYIFQIIFSFIPLALFSIYNKVFKKSTAFISVFYYMSNNISFFGVSPISLCKQKFAELFFVLSIILLLNKDKFSKKIKILFMIFGISIIISHYSISYIYIFSIIIIFLFLYKMKIRTMLNGLIVFTLLIIKLIWDTNISLSVSFTLKNHIKKIINRFIIDFTNPISRSSLLGNLYIQEKTIITQIHIFLFFFTNILIILGIIQLILKRKKIKLQPEYKILSIINLFIIVICLIIPNLASVLNFERIYSITILVLAPFFSLGGITFFNMIKKIGELYSNNKRLHEQNIQRTNKLNLMLLSFVLIAFFLFQTGFVNHIMNDKPISYSLDMNRMKTINNPEVKIYFYDAITPEQDVFSAIWVSKNVRSGSLIYSDRIPKFRVLLSYGLIPEERIALIHNNLILVQNEYIYLRYLNAVEGLVNIRDDTFNYSEFSSQLNEYNKIYSNGGSEIFSCSMPK